MQSAVLPPVAGFDHRVVHRLHGLLVVSLCRECGTLIGASPKETFLLLVEAAHKCFRVRYQASPRHEHSLHS